MSSAPAAAVPTGEPAAARPERPPAGLALEVLSYRLAVCRLAADRAVPPWAEGGPFVSLTRSEGELSIVCEESRVPADARAERGWRVIRVVGPLDFSLIGVLASLSRPLALARIGLFTISTFDTDYLLVRERHLARAVAALEAAGHRFDAEARAASASLLAAPPRPAPPAAAPAPVVAPSVLAPPPELPAVPEPTPLAARGDDEAGAETGFEAFGLPAREPAPDFDEDDDAVEVDFGAVDLEPRPAADAEEEPLGDDGRAAALLDLEPEDAVAPEGGLAALVDEPLDPSLDDTLTDGSAVAVRAALPADEQEELELTDADIASLVTGAIPQHPVETIDRPFDSLGLSPGILATVREIGFHHPTPIQASVIPLALEGRDVVGLAMTGSGKTAAFALPLAEKLHHGRGVRGLILSPTREIALQTKAFLDIFGRDHELDTAIVIGGVRMGPQIDALRRHPDIVVATPGRLADHLRRRNLRLDAIEHVVLDEADHMLDLGFLPQIKEILELVPASRQTMMFSATMPPLIASLARRFLVDPVRVDLRPPGAAAEGIEHRLYLVAREEDKVECLLALLEEVEGTTLVFTRRKLDAEWLARKLEQRRVPVESLHSDRSQAERVHALRHFREGAVRVLVATDVAARGLDIPRIGHVINFELPEQVEDYIHRAGRTARGANAGIVSTVGTWQDKPMVREIEDVLGKPIPRRTVGGIEPYQELPRRPQVRRRRLL